MALLKGFIKFCYFTKLEDKKKSVQFLKYPSKIRLQNYFRNC